MKKSGLITIVIGLILGSQVNAGAFSIIREYGEGPKGVLELNVVDPGLSKVFFNDGTGKELQGYVVSSKFKTGYEALYASEALRMVLGWNKFIAEHGKTDSEDTTKEKQKTESKDTTKNNWDTVPQVKDGADGNSHEGAPIQLSQSHSEYLPMPVREIVEQIKFEEFKEDGHKQPECGGGPESPSPVPEPSTILLLASGLIGIAAYRTKRRG